MNEFVITAIVVGGFVALFFAIWGVIALVDYIVDRRATAKWYKALATDNVLRTLEDTCKKSYEVWNNRSEIANGYQQQIDNLTRELHYAPHIVRESKEARIEEYKLVYYQARQDSDRWYAIYCNANNELNEYCKKNKLKRIG